MSMNDLKELRTKAHIAARLIREDDERLRKELEDRMERDECERIIETARQRGLLPEGK